MKKLFSLLCTLMCAGQLLAYSFEVDGIYYNKLGGDSVEVTYKTISYNSYSGSVTIPEVVTYSKTTYRVTTIGNYAFSRCSGLTSVTIPNSVTTIGSAAFEGCSGLTSVTIPNSVTEIGEWAFSGCSGLTSINVDAANTHYTSVDGVLFNYTKDTLVRCPIGNPRKEYTIPNSVTTIGERAFFGCSGLTSVTIPNSVTTIGKDAFSRCSGLTSVTIGNSVTTIGDYAFYYCKGLTLVTIPNSVTTIGSSAFNECSGLTSVTIPNSVTTIGSAAFSGCSGLTSVTIPNSVTTIGSAAFEDCTSLTSINVDAANTHYTSVDGVLFNYTKDTLVRCPIGNPRKEYTIPNSVTTIGNYAFKGCSGLTSVTIPNSVTTIGSWAFYGCKGLTLVTIPNSVTTIGNYAFKDCSGLKTITCYATNPPTCGSDCFYDVDKSIPVYVPARSVDAYKNASRWKEFTNLIGISIIFYTATGKLSETTSTDYSGLHTNAFNVVISSHTFSNGRGAITFNGEVTTIGSYAFCGCSGLTSVTIPNSVTTIGSYAFKDCSGLTSVTLNSNAICGKEYTLSSNIGTIFGSQVKEYIIGDSVTTIGEIAFYYCSGLTSVTIGNSVTTIGDYAFCECTGLTKTNYMGNIADWCKIKFGSYDANPMYYSHNFFINDVEVKDLAIPEGVKAIGSNAFCECTGLTSVTIPNSVTTIGSYAFSGCSGLTSVTIPNSVTTIGYDAFSGCSGLTKTNYMGNIADWCKIKFGNHDANPMYYSHNFFINDVEVKDLVIPEGVEAIGNYAFKGCSDLKTITCYATNPPTCGSDCFYDVDKSIPVYVPARSVDAYKNAYTWKDFTNLQANPNDLAVVTCNVIGNGIQTGAGTYIKGDTCTLTITFDAGYQLTQWNDGNIDNPRSFIVTQDTIFTAQIDTIRSGACGDDLTWKYNDGILVISGTGAMYDYTQGTAPWMPLFKDSISSLVINNGCTTIGNFAFYGLSNKNLKTIDIPNGVEQIGQFAFANCEYVKNVYLGLSLEKISANAFANDERLLYITCFAIEPPLLDESAFVNYDVYLSVPCESQNEYKVAKGWKLFNKENVSCIGAEEKPITGDEVTVTPSTDNATIVWPANDAAAEYTLVITKDGVVFCTLTFNAQGQLIGIAFAPNRDGELRTMSNAEMTATGWSFTVTGLNPGSTYSYTVDVVDAQKQSIRQYTGSFTTTGGVVTSLSTLTSTSASGKMLLDGHLYILRGDNLYTATGARVK